MNTRLLRGRGWAQRAAALEARTEFSHLLDECPLSTLSSHPVVTVPHGIEGSAFLPRSFEIWFHSTHPNSSSISTQRSPSGQAFGSTLGFQNGPHLVSGVCPLTHRGACQVLCSSAWSLPGWDLLGSSTCHRFREPLSVHPAPRNRRHACRALGSALHRSASARWKRHGPVRR